MACNFTYDFCRLLTDDGVTFEESVSRRPGAVDFDEHCVSPSLHLIQKWVVLSPLAVRRGLPLSVKLIFCLWSSRGTTCAPHPPRTFRYLQSQALSASTHP